MKKRVLAVVLAVALVLATLPVAVSASVSTPTGSETEFFANGTPITIAASKPGGKAQEVTTDTDSPFTGFTATGTDAYISWKEDGTTKYIGVSSSVNIFGGSDALTKGSPCTVSSTSIEMTDGTVNSIYAGHRGQESMGEPSEVTNNATVTITGGQINGNLCAGENNNEIKGTFRLTVTGLNADC